MKQLYLFISAYLLCVPYQILLAQGDTEAVQANQTELNELKGLYQELIPYPQEISAGGIYEAGGTFHIEGTAFLVSSEFIRGNVSINREIFRNLFLNYDVMRDQLVTYHSANFQQIVLDARKVEMFGLANDRTFMKIDRNTSYSWHKNGFYEVLLDAEIKFLSKHYKTEEIQRDYGSSEKAFIFINHEDFFVMKDQEFIRIRTKKDLANAAGISKKEINSVLRKNGLRFNKNQHRTMIEVGKAYFSNDNSPGQ